MNLIELYYQIKDKIPYCDKGTRHDYIPTYSKIFEPIKDETQLVLELGVFDGGSMCLWRNYFPKATIIGVDIEPRCKIWHLPDNKMTVIIGDCTKEDTYKNIDKPIDIIIDDASHKLDLTIQSFKILYPKLKPGGLYIIEDIQDLDLAKEIFDSLNISYTIVDTRHHKNVHDDVMFIFNK